MLVRRCFLVLVLAATVMAVGPDAGAVSAVDRPENGLFDPRVSGPIPTPIEVPPPDTGLLLRDGVGGFAVMDSGWTLEPWSVVYARHDLGDRALGLGEVVVMGTTVVASVVGGTPTTIDLPGCTDQSITAVTVDRLRAFLACGTDIVEVDLGTAWAPDGATEIRRWSISVGVEYLRLVPDAAGDRIALVAVTAGRTVVVNLDDATVDRVPHAVEVTSGHRVVAGPGRFWVNYDGKWWRYERDPVEGWGSTGRRFIDPAMLDLGDLLVVLEDDGRLQFYRGNTEVTRVPAPVGPDARRMLIGSWSPGVSTFFTIDTDDESEFAIATRWVDNGCTIVGTPSYDVLVGTDGDDVICGLGGDDAIFAGPGDDIVRDGAGDDVVFGGPGNDQLIDGPGTDILQGGDDDDDIQVRHGEAVVFAGNGDDHVSLWTDAAATVFTGAGNDRVDGAELDGHWIFTGVGDDSVSFPSAASAEPGTTVYLGAGIDRLSCTACTGFGGDGYDTLDATGGQPVTFHGGPGDDRVTGSSGGGDALWGGPGCDQLSGIDPGDDYWRNNEPGCVYNGF